jgi:hypothetical protein
MDEERVHTTALDIVLKHQSDDRRDAREDNAARTRARQNAEAARLSLAEMAQTCVQVVFARLHGMQTTESGVPITDEMEKTAWEVLSRIGVPKLRASAIAASVSAAPEQAAAGSPGWVDPKSLEQGDDVELDPASVDAQITAFFESVRADQSDQEETQ